MNRRDAIRTLTIAGAGSFIPRLLGIEDEYVLHSESRLVVLDVSVKDHGSVVLGLSQDNFKIFENDQPQHITAFDSGDLPVTVGILIDESRSMTPKRNEVLAAAQSFIAESNRQDEIFILNFNDRVSRGLPASTLFSDDIVQLRAALYSGVPEGKTAMNDAIVQGLEQLKLGQRTKKTLLLITDGGDNASTHNRHDMLGMVEKSLATIYTIGLFDEDDPDRDPGILREIAKISGGEAYLPTSPTQMISICHQIAREVRTRYTVGYVPQTGKVPNTLREVRVQASVPGRGKLTTRHRTTYRL